MPTSEPVLFLEGSIQRIHNRLFQDITPYRIVKHKPQKQTPQNRFTRYQLCKGVLRTAQYISILGRPHMKRVLDYSTMENTVIQKLSRPSSTLRENYVLEIASSNSKCLPCNSKCNRHGTYFITAVKRSPEL